MTAYDLLVAGAALLAGALASIVGFGIGSLLTPVLAMQAAKVAVAAVSVPHLIGTAVLAMLPSIAIVGTLGVAMLIQAITREP